MTSDRPYRNGMSREQALAVMQEVAGSQLDPKVVEVFISLAPELGRRTRARRKPAVARGLFTKGGARLGAAGIHSVRADRRPCLRRQPARDGTAQYRAAVASGGRLSVQGCGAVAARLFPRLRLMRPWPYVCCIMAAVYFCGGQSAPRCLEFCVRRRGRDEFCRYCAERRRNACLRARAGVGRRHPPGRAARFW